MKSRETEQKEATSRQSFNLRRLARHPEIRHHIVSLVTPEELDQRFTTNQHGGVIAPEHWYRKPEFWLCVRHNPTYLIPNKERSLLVTNTALLSRHLQRTTKVFYGVEVGTVESPLVDWDLQSQGHSEVIAIDVCRVFLEDFGALLAESVRKRGGHVDYLGV